MGVELGGDRQRRRLERAEAWSLAGWFLVGTLLVTVGGMWFDIRDLRDDQADNRRLIAELIEHEGQQVDLLCAKGVYVDEEACDGG